MADLSKPIAPEHLQTKVLKGQTITFIPRARPLPLQPRQQGEEAMTTTTIAKTRAGQPAPVLLTVQEAADLLRVTTRTLYQMVAEARIPYRRVGKALRFDRAEILEWTKTNTREE
jgi:excisionase family DNA binding protein